jgi:hypothetical protein
MKLNSPSWNRNLHKKQAEKAFTKGLKTIVQSENPFERKALESFPMPSTFCSSLLDEMSSNESWVYIEPNRYTSLQSLPKYSYTGFDKDWRF